MTSWRDQRCGEIAGGRVFGLLMDPTGGGLAPILARGTTAAGDGNSVFPLVAGIFLIVSGALHAAFPYSFWRAGMFGRNWTFRERPEPSQLALRLSRIGGVVATLVGVGLVIVWLARR